MWLYEYMSNIRNIEKISFLMYTNYNLFWFYKITYNHVQVYNF